MAALLSAAGILIVAISALATLPMVQTGTWQPIGPMSANRSGAAAILLQDHRVLVAGGSDASGPLNSAEVFNLVPLTLQDTCDLLFQREAGMVARHSDLHLLLPPDVLREAAQVRPVGNAARTLDSRKR